MLLLTDDNQPGRKGNGSGNLGVGGRKGADIDILNNLLHALELDLLILFQISHDEGKVVL